MGQTIHLVVLNYLKIYNKFNKKRSLKMEKILLIDDEEKFLFNASAMLGKSGFEVDCATSGKEGIEKIKSNYFGYGTVLLDLQMPEKDGVETYSEIKKINPFIHPIFLSAYLDQDHWIEKIENSTDENFASISKPFPMDTSDRFKEIVRKINIEAKKNKHRHNLNPFIYDLKSFLELSETNMDEIFKNAEIMHESFIEQFFQLNLSVDWIVIAKEYGNIIMQGNQKEELMQNGLMKLANENNCPIFTFTRPKVFEQIEPSWSCKCKDSEDYYPTITLKFNTKQGDQCEIISDFDTGSPETFISYEHAINSGIAEKMLWMAFSKDVVWGQTFRYYKDKFKCKVVSYNEGHGVPVIVKTNLVKNWEESPFVRNYQNRCALTGRNLLLENKIKLILNGEDKVTEISK